MDLWDPFPGGISPFFGDLGQFGKDDAIAIANTQLEWKETSDAQIVLRIIQTQHIHFTKLNLCIHSNN